MGIWNAIGSVFGTISNNRNIDKQLAAQKQENQATREWNLMLAEKQNAWNQQQWNLQNAYNSPTAQMERMRQAGLNPDMMYGGGVGGNTSSSSPEMTSGGSGSPMDWSALGSKRTIGDAILQAVQIDQAKANVEKTEAETAVTKSDAKVRDEQNEYGLETSKLNNEALKERLYHLEQQSQLLDYSVEKADWEAQMRREFGKDYVQSIVNKLANEEKKSAAELEFEVETLVNRIAGTNSENTPLNIISSMQSGNIGSILDLVGKILAALGKTNKKRK